MPERPLPAVPELAQLVVPGLAQLVVPRLAARLMRYHHLGVGIKALGEIRIAI